MILSVVLIADRKNKQKNAWIDCCMLEESVIMIAYL